MFSIMNNNKSKYYNETIKALESGEFLSAKKMTYDLSKNENVFFDYDFCFNEVCNAYHDYTESKNKGKKALLKVSILIHSRKVNHFKKITEDLF